MTPAQSPPTPTQLYRCTGCGLTEYRSRGGKHNCSAGARWLIKESPTQPPPASTPVGVPSAASECVDPYAHPVARPRFTVSRPGRGGMTMRGKRGRYISDDEWREQEANRAYALAHPTPKVQASGFCSCGHHARTHHEGEGCIYCPTCTAYEAAVRA